MSLNPRLIGLPPCVRRWPCEAAAGTAVTSNHVYVLRVRSPQGTRPFWESKIAEEGRPLIHDPLKTCNIPSAESIKSSTVSRGDDANAESPWEVMVTLRQKSESPRSPPPSSPSSSTSHRSSFTVTWPLCYTWSCRGSPCDLFLGETPES